MAHTPYHAFLASGIAMAAHKRGIRKTLYVVHDFLGAERLADALRGSPDNPFEYIAVLPGAHSFHKLPSSSGIGFLTSRIRRVFGDFSEITTLYVFNDSTPTSQYIARAVMKNHSDSRVLYVEDGTAAYVDYLGRREPGAIIRLLRRQLYGRWFEHIRVLGTSASVTGAVLAFPELARPELRLRSPRHLPTSAFRSQSFHEFANHIIQELEPNRILSRPESDIVLCLFPHSTQLHGEQEWVRLLADPSSVGFSDEARFLFKFHPRETEYGQFDRIVRSVGDRSVVPAEIGAEFLLASVDRIVGLVSAGSTPALSAIWLRPDVRNLAFIPDPELDQWLRPFEDIADSNLEVVRPSAGPRPLGRLRERHELSVGIPSREEDRKSSW